MILSQGKWEYFCAKQAELDAAFLENARWNPSIKDRETAFLVELGEFVNEFVRELRWWKHKWNDRDRMLDEFADTIHFISGISNTVGDGNPVNSWKVIHSVYHYRLDFWNVTSIPTLLQDLIRLEDVHEAFALSLYILKMQGFKESDLLGAYNKKNKVNFERIAAGY